MDEIYKSNLDIFDTQYAPPSKHPYKSRIEPIDHTVFWSVKKPIPDLSPFEYKPRLLTEAPLPSPPEGDIIIPTPQRAEYTGSAKYLRNLEKYYDFTVRRSQEDLNEINSQGGRPASMKYLTKSNIEKHLFEATEHRDNISQLTTPDNPEVINEFRVGGSGLL